MFQEIILLDMFAMIELPLICPSSLFLPYNNELKEVSLILFPFLPRFSFWFLVLLWYPQNIFFPFHSGLEQLQRFIFEAIKTHIQSFTDLWTMSRIYLFASHYSPSISSKFVNSPPISLFSVYVVTLVPSVSFSGKNISFKPSIAKLASPSSCSFLRAALFALSQLSDPFPSYSIPGRTLV